MNTVPYFVHGRDPTNLASKQMTTIQSSNLSTAQREAFELRQQDIGWGRAFAHLIPFYGLYYACKRRTITPFAYAFIGRVASAFMLGFLIGTVAPESEHKKATDNLLPVTLLAIPVWVKLGIDSARKQGADKLEGIQ